MHTSPGNTEVVVHFPCPLVFPIRIAVSCATRGHCLESLFGVVVCAIARELEYDI